MPLPILNNGKPLVAQLRADAARAVGALQAAEQRVVTQVRAATAKWNAANRLVGRTAGLTEGLKTQVERLERLFDQGQATLAQLLQARQRLIQLENAELDALWQATQAQADLLTAVGPDRRAPGGPAPCRPARLGRHRSPSHTTDRDRRRDPGRDSPAALTGSAPVLPVPIPPGPVEKSLVGGVRAS